MPLFQFETNPHAVMKKCRKENMGKWTIAILAVLLTGCSMSGNISEEAISKPVISFNREAPDTVYGEAVTTSNNYEVRAAIGEISEKKTTSNNYQIEGIFYQ